MIKFILYTLPKLEKDLKVFIAASGRSGTGLIRKFHRAHGLSVYGNIQAKLEQMKVDEKVAKELRF